jgi:hypothetical protein
MPQAAWPSRQGGAEGSDSTQAICSLASKSRCLFTNVAGADGPRRRWRVPQRETDSTNEVNLPRFFIRPASAPIDRGGLFISLPRSDLFAHHPRDCMKYAL